MILKILILCENFFKICVFNIDGSSDTSKYFEAHICILLNFFV